MLRRIMLSSLGLLVSVSLANAGFGVTSPPPKKVETPVENADYTESNQPYDSRYGVHPLIHQVIWGKKSTHASDCTTCGPTQDMSMYPPMGGYGMGYGQSQGYGSSQGCNGGNCHPIFGGPVFQGLFGPGAGFGQGGGYQGPSQPAQGTLVFPNHPYARSPRDFYMTDTRR